MKVHELIEFLKTQDQTLDVAYCCFSEQVLMQSGEIKELTACEPRPDGWIQYQRPDMPTQKYLLFSGN